MRASVEHGMPYARLAEFMQTGAMDALRWLRIVGDNIFAIRRSGAASDSASSTSRIVSLPPETAAETCSGMIGTGSVIRGK